MVRCFDPFANVEAVSWALNLRISESFESLGKVIEMAHWQVDRGAHQRAVAVIATVIALCNPDFKISPPAGVRAWLQFRRVRSTAVPVSLLRKAAEYIVDQLYPAAGHPYQPFMCSECEWEVDKHEMLNLLLCHLPEADQLEIKRSLAQRLANQADSEIGGSSSS